MRRWFKKVFKDITPIKNKSSVDRIAFSSNTNGNSYSNDKGKQTLRELNCNQLQSTLNVPEIKETPSHSSCVEYRTMIDEREGRTVQLKSRINEFSPLKLSTSSELQENFIGFRYVGKDEYKGITAYWNGTEGDAGYPNNYVQVCVRVFNPNSHPPLWGHFIYRFLIGWDEDLKLLIDWLLNKERTALDDVRLEYVLFPGNVIRLKPGTTARSLQIQQNSVLRFCHRFRLTPQPTKN